MHIPHLAGLPDPATWRAVPLTGHDRPGAHWAIVAGPSADDGEPDLYVEIAGAHPQAIAEYVIKAVRAHAARPASPSLLDAVAAARAELARTDTKTAVVVGAAGTAFSVLAALAMLAGTLSLPGRIALAAAVALLAAASSVALLVIRPHLPRSRAQATGVMAYAYARSAAEVLALVADSDTYHAQDAINLSQIAQAKYRYLRLATTLMLGGLAAAALAAAIGIGG